MPDLKIHIFRITGYEYLQCTYKFTKCTFGLI